MEQLINITFRTYLNITVFAGIWFVGFIGYIFKVTKIIDKILLKRVVRVGVCVICVVLWLWLFVYKCLYPISLAKYEYEHNITELKTGCIESIEQHVKDRKKITIDGFEYTIVVGSADPYSETVNTIVKKGTKVSFLYGKKI